MRIGGTERVTLREARATIDRYVRALARGEFRDAVRAAGACRKELMRRHRGRQVASQSTLTSHIRREARLRQLAYSKARWSNEDLRVAERFARAVVAGKYTAATLAAKACHAELKRVHGAREAGRPLSSVAMRIYELCRAMGLHTRAHWAREERAVLDRYLRALYAGQYRYVKQAARACATEMRRLYGRADARGEGDSGSAGRHSTGAVFREMNVALGRSGLPRTGSQVAPVERRLYEKYARAVADGRHADAVQAAAACRNEVRRIYARIGKRSPLRVRQPAPRSLVATQAGIRKAIARLGIQYPGRRWLPEEERIFNGWLRWYSRYHRVRRLQPLTQAANGLSDDLAKKGYRRTPRACQERLLNSRRKMMTTDRRDDDTT